MFLMVGNPVVRGQIVNLAAMTILLAKGAGFRLVVRAARTGINRRANKMGTEHLLFFQRSARGLDPVQDSGRSTVSPSELRAQQ